jgi:hypothetical protein
MSHSASGGPSSLLYGSGSGNATPLGQSPSTSTDWDAGPGPSSRVPKTSPTHASSTTTTSKRGSGIEVGEQKRVASRAMSIAGGTPPNVSGGGMGSATSSSSSSPATSATGSHRSGVSTLIGRVDATNLEHAWLIAEELHRELDVRERRFGNTVVQDCFSGSEAVSYMVSHGLAESNSDAIAVGNLLFLAGVIRYIINNHVHLSDLFSSPVCYAMLMTMMIVMRVIHPKKASPTTSVIIASIYLVKSLSSSIHVIINTLALVT